MSEEAATIPIGEDDFELILDSVYAVEEEAKVAAAEIARLRDEVAEACGFRVFEWSNKAPIGFRDAIAIIEASQQKIGAEGNTAGRRLLRARHRAEAREEA